MTPSSIFCSAGRCAPTSPCGAALRCASWPTAARVDAFEGESVAAALFAAGRRELRRSPRDGAPRGMFCLMGSCQECLVWVGSRKLPACQVPVTPGLEIETLDFREQRLG